MVAYQYKAIDSQGKVRTGSSDATSLENLTETLKTQGLFLMEGRAGTPVAPISSAPSATVSPPPKKEVSNKIGLDPAKLAQRLASIKLKGWGAKKTVPAVAITVFTTEFAVMIRTSLPLLSTLESLQMQQSNPKFKSVLGEIAKLVTQGKPLSEAFGRFPEVFDPIYVSLVAAGELSGTLSLMLERLAAYLSFQQELKAKIRLALLYPTIIVFTCLGVMTFLIFFILPTFANIFVEMSIDLPLPTRILLSISHHLQGWWWLYVVSAGGITWFFFRWMSNPAHLKTIQVFQLKIPVIGPLVRNIVMTRVLRTLASLIGSGVPILMSLDLTRAAAANVVFGDIVARIHKSASEGKGLATPLYKDPYFPESVTNMIANAEKMGALPEVLSKAADYYEHETDNTLKKTFAIIEPVFVVLLGVMVASIAVSVLLPIFKLNAGLQ
jgi:type II secretory pathway component PulF